MFSPRSSAVLPLLWRLAASLFAATRSNVEVAVFRSPEPRECAVFKLTVVSRANRESGLSTGTLARQVGLSVARVSQILAAQPGLTPPGSPSATRSTAHEA